MRKRRTLFTLCIVCCLLLFVLILVFKPVRVKLGSSNRYTPEEIQAAADVIEEKFKEFKGCKLMLISYDGDLKSEQETGTRKNCDEAIVMKTVFLSPLRRGGAWDPHQIYTWWFTLGRSEHGLWEILDWGG